MWVRLFCRAYTRYRWGKDDCQKLQNPPDLFTKLELYTCPEILIKGKVQKKYICDCCGYGRDFSLYITLHGSSRKFQTLRPHIHTFERRTVNTHPWPSDSPVTSLPTGIDRTNLRSTVISDSVLTTLLGGPLPSEVHSSQDGASQEPQLHFNSIHWDSPLAYKLSHSQSQPKFSTFTPRILTPVDSRSSYPAEPAHRKFHVQAGRMPESLHSKAANRSPCILQHECTLCSRKVQRQGGTSTSRPSLTPILRHLHLRRVWQLRSTQQLTSTAGSHSAHAQHTARCHTRGQRPS